MDIRKVFAKNMRAYRKKAGLTQETLGNLSGLHRTYIGGIEQGRRNVSLKNVGRIAEALGVSPMRLFIEFDGHGVPVFDSPSDDLAESGAPALSDEASADSIANCALVTWRNGALEMTPLSATEGDIAAQVLGNLVQLGYGDDELILRFNLVWPQICQIYGIRRGTWGLDSDPVS